MAERELWQLQSMQCAPLSVKVSMTKERIREWVNEYGEDGVYISFSGGKDSTVLLDIVRSIYPNIPAVFVDVPTQYPELREFAQSFENVTTLKPNISFMEVCEKYGFPLISKEVSDYVDTSRRFLKAHPNFEYNVPLGTADTSDVPARFKILCGTYPHKEKGVITGESSKMYNRSKYKYMLDADFDISSKCCYVMKKEPAHKYYEKTGRKPMIATMASESRLRTQKWLQHGCNGFDLKIPQSTPMSFWTEQDVLQYIYLNKIPICSVYGELVEIDASEGQISLFDVPKQLKTTGCERTGCMLCGFGCHLEKNPNRFEMLKETHPKMYALLDVAKNNGVTFREAIDWLNEHGNLGIKY